METAPTIDAYLAPLDADKRAALEHLRRVLHTAVPGLEECVSYGVPGVKLNGRLLVSFGAGKHHCAFYPGALPLEVHREALAGFETSRGTIRFTPAAPIPDALVVAIVATRLAEDAGKRRPRTRPPKQAKRT